MTRPRALTASAVVVASVALFYGVAQNDWPGGVLTGLILVAAFWACVVATQRSRDRQWHLDLDERVATVERQMAGALDDAEKARRLATRAASERVAHVVRLDDYVRDHVADPDAHSRREAAVPDQRTGKETR